MYAPSDTAVLSACMELNAHKDVCHAQEDLAAADVAKMVDMSPTEVADLLGQGSHNSPGATDAAALAQEVVCILVQLEIALCAGTAASHQLSICIALLTFAILLLSCDKLPPYCVYCSVCIKVIAMHPLYTRQLPATIVTNVKHSNQLHPGNLLHSSNCVICAIESLLQSSLVPAPHSCLTA